MNACAWSACRATRMPSCLALLSWMFAPPVGLSIGLFASRTLAKEINVDEPALLAGFAIQTELPSLTAAYPVCSNEPHTTPTLSDAQQLRCELEALGAAGDVTDVRMTMNCSCTSVQGVLRSPRGIRDGVVVLAMEVSEAHDLSGAVASRSAKIALQLAKLLMAADWLATDILLLLHSRCGCARTSVSRDVFGAVNQNDNLRHLLNEYHRLASPIRDSSSINAATAYKLHWGGPVRQLLAMTLGNRSTSGGDALRSLAVDLHGAQGRVPNFDLYATLWKAADNSRDRASLNLFSNGCTKIGCRACCGDHTGAADGIGCVAGNLSAAFITRPLFQAVHALLHASGARTMLRFTTHHAWGTPGATHDAALRLGIDGLTLRAEPACTVPHSLPSLQDEQLLSLLETFLRSLSNLDEALHHSLYTYLLAEPSRLVPLSTIGPWLHLSPLVALVLRSAAHGMAHAEDPLLTTGTTHGLSLTTSIAFGAVAVAHVSGALMPTLLHFLYLNSTNAQSSTLQQQHSASIVVQMLLMAWLIIACLLTFAAWRLPRHLNSDALGHAVCTAAVAAAVWAYCISLSLGFLCSMVLAAALVLGLPFPLTASSTICTATRTPKAPMSSRALSFSLHIIMEILMLIFCCPYMLIIPLTTASLADSAELCNPSVISAVLPFAFSAALIMPTCAVVASIRLCRLAVLLRSACDGVSSAAGRTAKQMLSRTKMSLSLADFRLRTSIDGVILALLSILGLFHSLGERLSPGTSNDHGIGTLRPG